MKTTRQEGDREEVNVEAVLIAYDYIQYRLRKAEYTWYRCPALQDPQRPCLIMRELGDEFERMYSEKYGELSSLLHATRFTSYHDFRLVCDEIFRGADYRKVDGDKEVKWSRIVALFVFGGVIAVQFVQNGLEEQLSEIPDWISMYVRHHLSYWICKQGGWDGLSEYYETRELNKRWDQVKGQLTGVGTVCGVVALAALLAWRCSH